MKSTIFCIVCLVFGVFSWYKQYTINNFWTLKYLDLQQKYNEVEYKANTLEAMYKKTDMCK